MEKIITMETQVKIKVVLLFVSPERSFKLSEKKKNSPRSLGIYFPEHTID